MKRDYEYLEFLNKDYLEIIESKEYKIGRRICMIKDLIKRGKFITLFKKINTSLRIKKYNNHPTEAKKIIGNHDLAGKKIAVYTCMAGDYDYIRKPKYMSDNCDYFIITDIDTHYNTLKRIEIPKDIKEKFSNNSILINRYYKMHPFELFDGYDYAIYIDSNVEVISDISKMIKGIDDDYGLAFHAHSQRKCIYNEVKACKILKKGNSKKMKEQVKRYKRIGFPKDYGMLECNVIVSDLKNLNAIKILNDWWMEYVKSESLRDQLALPYVLWKNGVPIEELTGLGSNVFKNPIIRINKKHKKK